MRRVTRVMSSPSKVTSKRRTKIIMMIAVKMIEYWGTLVFLFT